MKEPRQCEQTLDFSQTLTSSSLSVADSFVAGLETSHISHQSSPVCAHRKPAGFADKSTSVAQPQTQTRYGEPVAVSADGNASYFGTDILGSVRNVTDKYGNVQSNYNYDAFGAPYLSNLDNDMSFGYCGKVYDNGTGLYDYGFRDYSPNQARFTTVDPIRDGNNWFSYVVNDPVNYVDPFGLTATDVENYTYQGERDGRRYYKAKPEATMWGLANDTGTDLGDVQGYDGDPHRMPIGTELSIPAKPSTPTPPAQPAPSAPAPEAPAPTAPAPTVPTPSVPSAPPVSTGNLSSPSGGHSNNSSSSSSKGIDLSEMTINGQKTFLAELNRYSYYQISLKDNNLVINPDIINLSGSKTFGNDLILAITGDVQIKIIIAANVIKGNEKKTIEGGFCIYNAEKKEALIAINPNTAFYQSTDGSINIATIVGVFVHELSGHLLPEIYNINGNAIEKENVIRKELSLPLRKEDPSHVCF